MAFSCKANRRGSIGMARPARQTAGERDENGLSMRDRRRLASATAITPRETGATSEWRLIALH